MNLQKILPVFKWLSEYNKPFFRKDFIAAITVSVMLIPQGMAYAMLAGMPPIYGLYGGLVPLFIYGLMGTSRQLSIGPVAVSSLLVLAGVSQIAEPGSAKYIELVLLAGLLIGFLQLGIGLLRLGFLANFLSHPVIIGFSAAAAVIIGLSQLKYLLGFPIPRFERLYQTLGYAFQHLHEIHWLSFAICAGGIFLLAVFRSVSRSFPGALIVTVLGVGVVLLFDLDQKGVNIVGEVPGGLPGFDIVNWNFENIKLVFPTVLTVGLMGIVESISIAKMLEVKNKDTIVRPNQELLAIGVSKIAGAFFQALPTSASFTRSAVNDEAGAKTGISSIMAATFVALTLIALTPLFYYLPEAILAAIVLVAVKGLFNWKAAIYLWKNHPQDFAMMLATFIFTLALGIEEGVLIGVILSLLMIIYRTSQAHIAELGQLPNTNYYRNVKRFKEAIKDENVLILRFDSQLYFGNAAHFKSTVMDRINNRALTPKLFILDASSIQDMDSSGLDAMEEVLGFCKGKNIQFMVAGVIGPVRDLMFKTGFMEQIGKENYFMYIHDAVYSYKHSKNGEVVNWTASAIQTNLARKT